MLPPRVRVRLVAVQEPVLLSMVMGLAVAPISPAEVREMVGAVIEPLVVVVTEDEFARVNDCRLRAWLRVKALLLVGSTVRLRLVLVIAAWVAIAPLVW